jgi:tRNA pseudouridine38-40 synthase
MVGDGRTKIVLLIEYEGTRYHGFQWQKNAITVQGELESAIHKMTGETLRVMAASRTDAGVHALGQVASFRTGSAISAHSFMNGLNFHLPADIAIRNAHVVDYDFNVRKAAQRHYRYYILNRNARSPFKERYAYHLPRKLNIEIMNEACESLIGEHDFAPFVSEIAPFKTTVRTVYDARMARNGEMVTFDIKANSFLPHQVRNMIGALINVGLDKMQVKTFQEMARCGQRGVMGPTAPACGLWLMQIDYVPPLGEAQ